MEPTYSYHVYDSTGAFAGYLTNVISEFSYSHQLGQAGCQLDVVIGVAPDDVGATEDVDLLVTEDSDYVVDDNNNNITTRLDYIFAAQPINLGNRVIVHKHDENYPDGFTSFDGVITSWAFDYTNQAVKVIILSHGIYLDQYIVNTSSDLEASQLTSDSTISLTTNDPAVEYDRVAQTFSIATDVSLSSVEVLMASANSSKVCFVYFKLVAGTPDNPGSTLFEQIRQINNSTAEYVSFSTTPAVSLNGGDTYHFVVGNANALWSGYTYPIVSYINSSAYASGTYWDKIDGAAWTSRTRDLAFKVNTTDGSTAGSFLNTDPAQLARAALDVYNAQGGFITYNSSSIETSNIQIDYTFKVGTIWEAIKKAYELCPSNYFLAVDPSDNLVYLKARSNIDDHIFIKGKHLSKVDIEYTLDGIKNTVYFSGGDTGGGSNLFLARTNSGSRSKYGQWLDRASDNRVTNTDTAETIIAANLSRNSTPKFRTKISISAAVYDIETIFLGDMIAFAGFDSLIDNLLLCVVGLKRSSNMLELELGENYPRQSQRVEKLQRDLIFEQTKNNPEVAS